MSIDEWFSPLGRLLYVAVLRVVDPDGQALTPTTDAILEISPTATAQQIRDAYKRFADRRIMRSISRRALTSCQGRIEASS